MCQKQIFISYSRADNVSLAADEVPWVSQFAESTERGMKSVRCDAVVWMDIQDNARNMHFWPQIQKALDESDVLIVILSENWLASEFCRKEFEYFNQKPSLKGKEVFIVSIEEILNDETINLFEGLTPSDFYKKVEFQGVFSNSPMRPNRKEGFSLAIKRLARSIKEVLHNDSTPKVEIVKAPVREGLTVLLTRATPDQLGFSDQLFHEFEAHGIQVIEPSSFRKDAETQMLEWGELVESADVVLQLIGSQPYMTNTRLGDDSQLQLNQKMFNSAKVKAKYTWISPSVFEDECDHELRELAQQIRDQQRVDSDFLLLGSKQNTKIDLLKMVEMVSAPKTTNSVYVVYSKEDAESVGRLTNFLISKNIPIEPSIIDDIDPERRDSHHREQLEIAKGVILFWGDANDFWVRQKLDEIRKYSDISNKDWITDKVGFFGLPKNPQKNIFGAAFKEDFTDIYVCDGEEDTMPESIEGFVQRIQGM